jgi:hypothetical protein
MERCCGCGAEFPEMEGPTHPYILSSPGCWQAYCEVLAREYQDRNYWPLHRLTVDTYAVQHPGVDNPQARNSVGIHLSRLCLMFDASWTIERVNGAMQGITARKMEYEWLAPPIHRGNLTVQHVLAARSATDHLASVEAWARSVWEVWAEYHVIAREWVKTSMVNA